MFVKNLYVIYYGWLIAATSGRPNSVARIIASVKPKILVASMYTLHRRYMNLSPQVRDLLHAGGVRICAYVPTKYGSRALAEVKAEVKDCLAHGVDGIFFDEVYDFADDLKKSYYLHLYTLVKDCGRMVIMNTGVAQSSESIMTVTDILMVEHLWRSFSQACPWRGGYTPDQFMGNSSNEPGASRRLGYGIDSITAVRDTKEAWADGIGWHYSTDRYTTLPAWFLSYVNGVGYRAGSKREPRTEN